MTQPKGNRASWTELNPNEDMELTAHRMLNFRRIGQYVAAALGRSRDRVQAILKYSELQLQTAYKQLKKSECVTSQVLFLH